MMPKSLQRNNKMFLTKKHIAKWFLILLCLLQCCFSEEPGRLLDELTTTESNEPLTDPLLISLHAETTQATLHSETESEAVDEFEVEKEQIYPTTTSESPSNTDESSASADEPGTKSKQEKDVTSDSISSNLFLRRFGFPDDEGDFGSKIPAVSATDGSSAQDHPLNIDDFSLKKLDSWRPVWPYSGPLANDEKLIENSPQSQTPKPVINPVEISPVYSVEKEPITAYYFDLATPENSPAPGPLHDPTNLSSSIESNKDSTSVIFPTESLTQSSHSGLSPSNVLKPQPISEPPSVELVNHTIPNTQTLKVIPVTEASTEDPTLGITEENSDATSLDMLEDSEDPNTGDSLDLSSTSTQIPDTNKMIKSTNLRKINTRVPLWKRLSKKISATGTDVVSMLSTVALVSPTPVYNFAVNEDDIPLGILSAGLPIIPELASSFLLPTETSDLIDSSITLETPSLSLPTPTIGGSLESTNTRKITEDKTILPNNAFKVPINDRDQLQDPVTNINSIPEPKIKSVRNPEAPTPDKVSETFVSSTKLESWIPLVNGTATVSSTTIQPAESSSKLVPQVVSSLSYDLQSKFTPIAASTSLSPSPVPLDPTKSTPPLSSTPPTSTLYIVQNGEQVPLLEDHHKESNLFASKTKKLSDSSTAILSISEAPLSHVDNLDPNLFVTIAEKEATENPANSSPVDNFTEFPSTESTPESSSSTPRSNAKETEQPPPSTEADPGESSSPLPTTKPTTTTPSPPSSTAPTTTSTSPSTSSTSTTESTTSTKPSTTITSTPSTLSSTSEGSHVEEDLPTLTPNFTSTTPGQAIETTTESKSPEQTEAKITTHFEKPSEAGAELSIIEMHDNGTNGTKGAPFVKASVSYDTNEFCQHKNNIRSLLAEWLHKHLQNSESNPETYEVEIFHQPNCEDILSSPDAPPPGDHSNETNLYFYIKKDGQISPNTTLGYPHDFSTYEISQELEYLREKIVHLELVNNEKIILEEAAAVGTSIIVIVVVSIILILVAVAAVFALVVIKRRRNAENNYGRRCRPAANDAYSMDSVSVYHYNHSFKRKSKKRFSSKSLRSYLNQGFDDPNGPSRALNFAKLTHFISDNEGIHKEFENIPSVHPNYEEMPKGCEDKNRFANVIPIPETRILLKANKGTPSSEYINANSVHGPRGEQRYYIATQAPLDETICDFWQMIWEQESRVIVMLTDFIEKGIDRCADYIPPSETLDCHRVYGDFQITLKSRDMRDKYIASQIQLKNLENNLTREICHMWYTGWPDSGVPSEEAPFISFIFDVRMTRKRLRSKGPIIVHCSPGTGRTGSYIACDISMKHFEDQKSVDVPKTVYKVRRERAGAVQTKEQYAFIYRVVNLYAAKLTTGNLDSF